MGRLWRQIATRDDLLKQLRVMNVLLAAKGRLMGVQAPNTKPSFAAYFQRRAVATDAAKSAQVSEPSKP